MTTTTQKVMQDRLKVQVATSARMDRAIEEWLLMYMDNPPWAGRDGVHSLNLPATVAEEISRLLLTEFSMHVDGDGDGGRAELINESLADFINNLPNSAEIWAALGGVAIKPYAYGDDGMGRPEKIMIDVVPANRFYPTTYDSNGRITGAVFIEAKRKGDYLYTRLEQHSLEGRTYTVKNLAFRSERLNPALTEDDNITATTPFLEPVPLEEIDDWAGLAPEVTLTGINEPLFVYIKNPRKNQTDPTSPLGASIYERAREAIAEADRQYSRILWEYEATEAAVEADETLFKMDKDGRPVIPAGKERLYRTYDVGGGSEKTTFLQVYSPEIRDSSLYNGLNKQLRNVEMLCGLAFGTISDINVGANAQERTATELRISRQRSYTTISRMQDAWDAGLRRLVEIISLTISLYEMAPDTEQIETCITWGDGVLEDTDMEYQRRWAMVLAGKLKIEKFYAWYFGCSEEEALDMVPDQNPLFPPAE